MEMTNLIDRLTKEYAVPRDKLEPLLRMERKVFLISPSDPLGPPLGYGRPFPEYPEYHIPVYGETIVKVKIGGRWRSYDIDNFLKLFKDKILFLVPLYGAYEYGGDSLEVQKAIKSFAVDFGRHAKRSVLVFDYWTDVSFNPADFERQERDVMKQVGVSAAKVPALLVANRSPFSWPKNDSKAKCVVLSFRSINTSDIGPRLRSIAADLKNLQIPSRWAHDWSRLSGWCKKHGILGSVFGALLGAAGDG